jgi:integrase
MASPCHTHTKEGQGKGAANRLRRLFGVLVGLLNTDRNKSTEKPPKSQLTNAEYHLTAKEMAKIVTAATLPRDKAILMLLAETGLRRAEVASLQIEDIRWNKNLLIVRNGKGGKMRLVPLTQQLKVHLSILMVGRKGSFVFESSRSSAISPRQLNRIVAAAGKKAGVNNPNPRHSQVTPHLLRHSFARLWKDKGGSIEALSKILGHKSVKTTWDAYGTMSLEDIQKDYRKVMADKPGGREEKNRRPFG